MGRQLRIRSRRFLHVVSVLMLVFLMEIVTGPVPVLSQSSPDAESVIPLGHSVPHSEVCPDVEVQLFDLLNRTRRAHSLPPLVMDRSLRFVARSHSQDMAKRGYFGHGAVSGESFAERMSHVVRKGLIGENVAIASTADQANRAFAASPGHLENMLQPSFHRVGIGIATAGDLGMMMTEDFAE